MKPVGPASPLHAAARGCALALAHARHHAGRSLILACCVAVAVLLPVATRVIMHRFETALLARSSTTPMIVGAKGNRFDLTLACLYFRRIDLPTITMGDLRQVNGSGLAGAMPINTRFTARNAPIVASSPDYFDFRGLEPAVGELPLTIGEVVLGSAAARALALSAGDTLFSDVRELYDITRPPAMKLVVTGILAPSGSPDDQAIFTDIKTAWALEGLSHAHAEPASVPDALVLEKSGQNTVISEELVSDNQATRENAAAFHVHANPDTLPLTAMIVLPNSEKDRAILAARLNAGKTLQAVMPRDVIHELLAQVLRLRRVLDGVAVLVAAFTSVLLALVGLLSLRLRARETETLHRIGVSRFVIGTILGGETAFVVAVGAALAGLAALALWLSPLDVVKLL
jgi:putative ABC transport system permease protein